MDTNNTNTQHNSNNIVSFSFENHAVRGFEYRGEAHFIGNEVTDALGYTNASKALNDHCKALKKLNYNESLEMGLTEQGKNLRGISIIPERDVYRLVMRSNLPTAEAFEEKVVGEILPAIRKTGGYMVAAPEETPEEIMLRALTIAKETVDRQKLELEVANERTKLQAAMLVAARPKIDALDRISTSDGSYGLQEAAKILQVGPRAFVQWLRTNRWIYKRPGSTNYLGYQDRINAGYLWHKVSTYETANGETRSRDDVKILPKGLTRLAREVPGASLDPDLSPVPVPGDAAVPFTQAPA